jgi:HEAT repeat protein
MRIRIFAGLVLLLSAAAAGAELADDLVSLNDQVREKAFEQFSTINLSAKMEVLPRLLRCVKFQTGREQKFAAEAVGKIGLPAAGAVLAAAQGDTLLEKSPFMDIFRDMGPGAPDEIALRLDEKDKALRITAAAVLGILNARTDRAVPVLVEALAEKNSETIQVICIRALLFVKPAKKEAVVAVAKKVSAGSEAVKACAVQTLGDMGPAAKYAVNELIAEARDGNEEKRLNAVRALGKIGEEAEAALPLLLEYQKSEDKLLKLHAMYAVAGLNVAPDRCVPPLIELIESPDKNIAEAAVHCIGSFEKDADMAVPALAKLLEKCADEEIKRRILDTLGAINTDDSKEVLKNYAEAKKKKKGKK